MFHVAFYIAQNEPVARIAADEAANHSRFGIVINGRLFAVNRFVPIHQPLTAQLAEALLEVIQTTPDDIVDAVAPLQTRHPSI
jgi:hypothetical protein